jgi:hypothetical protein
MRRQDNFFCNLAKNVGMGKDDTDNSVVIIVFENTEIFHPFNHTVPEQSVVGIYV